MILIWTHSLQKLVAFNKSSLKYSQRSWYWLCCCCYWKNTAYYTWSWLWPTQPTSCLPPPPRWWASLPCPSAPPQTPGAQKRCSHPSLIFSMSATITVRKGVCRRITSKLDQLLAVTKKEEADSLHNLSLLPRITRTQGDSSMEEQAVTAAWLSCVDQSWIKLTCLGVSNLLSWANISALDPSEHLKHL